MRAEAAKASLLWPKAMGETGGGPPYDAVFFDMGYTLVYFEPAQERIVQNVLQATGVERSVDEIRAAVDAVWGDYYKDAEAYHFPATEEYDRQVQETLGRSFLVALGLRDDKGLLQTYMDAIDSSFNRPGVIRPYPEVVEVLTTLQEQGYRLGIISNWSWNLRDRVVQAGLDGFFEIVWASAYAGCNKPHPGIFRQALAKMQLGPEQAFYVGDSYDHDVIGAWNASLDVALLDRNGTSGDPDFPVVRDLRGILKLV